MKYIEQQRTHIPADTAFVRRKFLDLPYMQGGERQTLDIYLPNEGDGPFPVVLDIFGGGWYFGQKSSHKLEPALHLLRRGFAVVSINYSLSWQAQFPAQVQEIKTAIRFVKASAARYGLDKSRVALLGESAGAHYAALCAVSSAAGRLEDKSLGWAEESSEAQAVIAVYCPSDLGRLREDFWVMGQESDLPETGESDSMEGALFGRRAPRDVPELVRLANPVTYITGRCPPFLFLHGDRDRVIPVQQSRVLAAEIMRACGRGAVEYHIVEGARHDIHDFEREDLYDLEADFLRRKLGI